MLHLSSRLLRCSSRLFHSSRVLSAEGTGAAGGKALSLRFVTPHETIVNNKPVYMVTVPAVSGLMGILADHAPTLAQLKPGLVTVHTADINDVTHKFFVSGGFAVVKADSTASVTAVEAIKLEDLDIVNARKGLDEANAAVAKANTEADKAQAQIAQETYEALVQALEAK